jgi:stage II sporulation protein D
LQAAAEATEGELLWHEGQPAATYYHRNCGGMTEASDRVWGRLNVPYLPGQVDSYCVRRGREEWHSEISKEDLQRALAAAGVNVPGRSYSLAVVGRTPSGRVERLRLRGTVSVLIAARTLRFAVGRVLGWDRIRSDLYDLSDRGDRFVLHGHGAGHGVGLCQAGAARMGEEGKTYREILEFYYPGTTLGLTAQGISWQALATERTELLTTRPQEDQPVLALAEQLMRGAEEQSGWDFKVHPRLKVYPTVAAFRDGTARPGWVAASTRGRVIRLQPLRVLRSRRILEPTLRHELFHLLVESRAHRSLPLWFREGIVLYLAQASPLAAQAASPQGETGVRRDSAALEQLLLAPQSREEMEQAYRAVRARVEALVARYGREIVLGWVERGLPPS